MGRLWWSLRESPQWWLLFNPGAGPGSFHDTKAHLHKFFSLWHCH